MNKARAAAIGVFAGSIAVLTLWLTRVVLPPRERPLPDVIRLDTMDAYSARPSTNPQDLLADHRLLERVVESFEVTNVTRASAIRPLASLADVNIVMDSRWWSDESEKAIKESSVTLSLKSHTVDQIIERICLNVQVEPYEEPVWYARGGIIFIVSRSDHSDASFVIRVYDVRDLMLQSRRVSSAFPATTKPTSDKWDAILHGSEQEAAERLVSVFGELTMENPIREIHYFAGKLLVRATRNGHREAQQRLEALRKVR
jgi:hypothetical protein